jgi:hypothetical protein
MDDPNQKKSLLIGIDPDTEASGWAVVNLNDRTIHLETISFLRVLDQLNFFEVLCRLHELRGEKECAYRFVLEDIWSTAHNWHASPRDNHRVVAKKGYHLGRCAMVGELLLDAIQAKEFPIICQKPLLKHWRGPDGKITHSEILEVCRYHNLTLPKSKQARTNQEERDALLLAIHHIATPTKLFDK